MEVEIFTLSDFAQEHGGKLFINGTFDTIFSPSYPLVYPSFTVVCKIRFSDKEMGLRKIKLVAKTPDGKDLINPIEGDIQVNKPAPIADFASMNLAFNFMQINFEKPGTYTFELFVDNEWESGLKLIAAKQ